MEREEQREIEGVEQNEGVEQSEIDRERVKQRERGRGGSKTEIKGEEQREIE